MGLLKKIIISVVLGIFIQSCGLTVGYYNGSKGATKHSAGGGNRSGGGSGGSGGDGGTNGGGDSTLTPMNLTTDGIDSADDNVTTKTITTDPTAFIQSLVVDLGADFKSTNICSGKTIYGRDGVAMCTSGGTL